MNATWLEDLLPSGLVSPKTTIWWLAFFLLFPLAYAGGVMLGMAQERPARIPGSEDRTAAIRTAEQFAVSKGFSITNWHVYVIEENRDNLVAYYDDNRTNPAVNLASTFAPAREVQVLFRSPDQNNDFRVYLSLTGQVTGYDSGRSSDRSPTITGDIGAVHIQTNSRNDTSPGASGSESNRSVQDHEAEDVARRNWARNPAFGKVVQLGEARISTNENDSSREDLVWDVTPTNLKGLTLHITSSVRGTQVLAQHVEPGVDKEHVQSKSGLKAFLEGLYSLFLTFSAFFAMYRYAKRTLQKEVSHGRTLVVALLFAVSYGVLAYSFGVDQIATRVSGPTFAKIGIFTYILSATVFVGMGLLVGIAYGSGEGELREAYPGKLTSLDALLAGRLFSRDVAASFLFGVAVAGWLLLIQYAIGHFLQSDVLESRRDALNYTFSRLPWITLVFGRQYDSLLIPVAGLLLPASFLLRRKVRRQRRYAWLILFALLSVLGDAAKYPTFPLAMLEVCILTSALLLPFFSFDLLAAMVSISAVSFVTELVRLTEVVSSWATLAWYLAACGAVALAAVAYLALQGRRVREEEVRPLYAKNLAERMAMQAEISAAREAQLRLLPQSAPELPGIQVAACCLPARGVGGDFYDFFRLDPNRVGIFVAQGGGQGLASALCIALAKGLLMHASQQSHSPTQIILGLEENIEELLESGTRSGISFAYGVMDSRRGQLTYARIGSSPRLMIHREGGTLTAPSQLEREVRDTRRTQNANPIYEGVAHARPGDLLIFLTEGLLSLQDRRGGRRGKLRMQDILRQLRNSEQPLQSSLLTALGKSQNDASEDLTAVVLRIAESQASLQEVVA